VFPTLFTVTHNVATSDGINALGQPVVVYTSTERAVYGWSSKSTADANSAALVGRTITELSLLTPDGDWAHGDTVTLPGRGDFMIVGDPEDMNAGPFGFAPGYRVTLRRVHDGS